MTDADPRRRTVAALFDQLAPTYDQGGVPWFRPIARRLVQLVEPRPGERALDVGAGRGAATLPLADAVGPSGHVTALDLSPAMCAALREATADAASPVEVVCGEARRELLPGDGFDVVTASLVLFFDPEPEATLAAWVELLRPGGRIGLTTFGPVDDAWRAAEAAVFAHAPTGLLDARTAGTRGPFADTGTLAALLEASGATGVESHDEPLEVVLPDAAAWQAWTMSLGMRQAWLSIPEGQREAVLAASTAALEADRAADGLLHLTQQVRYTTGHAPG